MVRFFTIYYLYLLILIPLLILFYIVGFRKKKKALGKFGNLELIKKLTASVSLKRQVVKVFLILLSVLFMVLSLARPQIGTSLEEVRREGVDIIIALDVSYSMMAEDIKPNRLEKAKHEILNLIDLMQGDRVGLIAFAGVPFVQCPLTLDYGAARMFLNSMDVNIIPEPGTGIAKAIDLAVKTFEERERKYKVLILITDGEDHLEDPLEAARRAESQGVIIYTVGVGSVKGVPIPMYNTSGNNIGFKKDRSGQVVTSKLDEVMLEKVALQTNGKYYRASGSEEELKKIYQDISKMEKKELGSIKFSQYEDRFQYLLVISILCLVIEMLVSERKRLRKEWMGRFS